MEDFTDVLHTAKKMVSMRESAVDWLAETLTEIKLTDAEADELIPILYWRYPDIELETLCSIFGVSPDGLKILAGDGLYPARCSRCRSGFDVEITDRNTARDLIYGGVCNKCKQYERDNPPEKWWA
jgi:hypothetical protein